MDIIAGRFRVDRWLGEGNLGQLYLVEQIETPFRNTLRVLPSGTAGGATPRTPLTDFVTRIQHQNLVRVDEVGQTADGLTYVVMDHSSGTLLAEVVARGGVPLRWAVEMVQQMIAGIRAAHESGTIHGALHAESVMIGSSEDDRLNVRILDLGLFALFRERGCRPDPRYASVEVLTGRVPDAAQRRLQPRRRRLSPPDRHAVWNSIAGAESDPTGTGRGAEDGPRQRAGGSLRQRGATRPCAGAGVARSRGRVEHGNHNARRDVRPSGEGDSASSDSDSEAGRGEGAAHDVGICTRSRPDRGRSNRPRRDHQAPAMRPTPTESATPPKSATPKESGRGRRKYELVALATAAVVLLTVWLHRPATKSADLVMPSRPLVVAPEVSAPKTKGQEAIQLTHTRIQKARAAPHHHTHHSSGSGIQGIAEPGRGRSPRHRGRHRGANPDCSPDRAGSPDFIGSDDSIRGTDSHRDRNGSRIPTCGDGHLGRRSGDGRGTRRGRERRQLVRQRDRSEGRGGDQPSGSRTHATTAVGVAGVLRGEPRREGAAHRRGCEPDRPGDGQRRATVRQPPSR